LPIPIPAFAGMSGNWMHKFSLVPTSPATLPIPNTFFPLIPAKAGTQTSLFFNNSWNPAYAFGETGMTTR